jgi:diguanylate cyclase (GGDEF)-like protein
MPHLAIENTRTTAAAQPVPAMESGLRNQIQTLSYLPTAATVALKFIELGRDPDTGPNEYAKVISADPSLASKLLALANSSWFGVRQKVTKVPMAVSLLGLCNVRALALSYCMTGLHHELGLSREDSLAYWESGLCKAVTARRYVHAFDASLSDMAFAAGVFQDFALPIMHTVDKGQTAQVLADPTLAPAEKLTREKTTFGMNHCEAGRLLAQKLELPDFYTDAIAFHHDVETLSKYSENEVLAEGIYLAGLMPHARTTWHADDIQHGRELFDDRLQRFSGGWEPFLAEVQTELDELFAYFQDGRTPDMQLKELMVLATKEVADNTTSLVGQVHQMMTNTAVQGQIMHEMLREKETLEEKSLRDPLTKLLNREGLQAKGSEPLERAKRYKGPLAVAFVDIDHFKSLNDAYGHPFGDYVLSEVASRMRTALGDRAVLSRPGGDEFVAILGDLSREEAEARLNAIRKAPNKAPFKKGKVSAPVTWSVGMVWTKSVAPATTIEDLVHIADEAMYKAKQQGRNRAVLQTI